MKVLRVAALACACISLAVVLPAESGTGKTTASSRHSLPDLASPLAPASWVAGQPFIDGKRRSAADLTASSVVVFFFCGCPQCHAVAGAWAQAEAADESGPQNVLRRVLTLVSFDGSPNEARQFESDTGLVDLNPKPIVATDPDDRLRERFGIVSCPQVYVFGGGGKLAYSTRSIADTQTASPIDIVSHALSAARGEVLRAAGARTRQQNRDK